MARLAGKVAIVTGSTRGIGAAIARAFVAEGAKVLVSGTAFDRGEEMMAELGDAAIVAKLDVTSPTDWAEAVAMVEKRFGAVTVLVNNAGVGDVSPFDDVTEAICRHMIEVNQMGTFFGIKAVLPSMRTAGRGSIVNISSIAGLVGNYFGFAYIASKFAVTGMTKAAGAEFARENIRVNAIHPGMINTDMLAGTDMAAGMFDAVPLRRIGETAEVAPLAVMLASDESSYITGASFVVDGGATAV